MVASTGVNLKIIQFMDKDGLSGPTARPITVLTSRTKSTDKEFSFGPIVAFIQVVGRIIKCTAKA